MTEELSQPPAISPHEARGGWFRVLRTMPVMAALVAVLGALGACSSEAEPTVDSGPPVPDGVCDAPKQVFAASCGAAACHDPGNQSLTVDLITNTTADPVARRLVNMPATYTSVLDPANCPTPAQLLIDPNNIDASLLMVKLMGTQSCGLAMPMIAPMLPDADIQCVRSWASYAATAGL